jgi:hypothetical protein
MIKSTDSPFIQEESETMRIDKRTNTYDFMYDFFSKIMLSDEAAILTGITNFALKLFLHGNPKNIRAAKGGREMVFALDGKRIFSF